MMTRYFYIIIIFLASCSGDDFVSNSVDDDAKTEFEKRTGLELSDSTINLKETDTYFPHEGEYSIVFRTSPHQIETWLKSRPPWKNQNWRRGQIPHEVGMQCQFNFPDRVGVSSFRDGTKSYTGDKDLENLLNDSTNYYVFREDCCPENGLNFHDGALLIMQPGTGLVYYSNWNY